MLAGSAPSWRIKVKSIDPGDRPWLGPAFGHELVSLSAHSLHLLPFLPARLLPAACLAGPTPTPALPKTGLFPACCRTQLLPHLTPPAPVPSLSDSLSLGHGLLSLAPRAAAPLTKYVPLICLLVELKSQTSTKTPAKGLERGPWGQGRATPDEINGGSVKPVH